MALREKFGRLVLLEETEAGPLGQEFRAARLGPAGLDRLVTVLRFSPAVSAHPDATKLLLLEARLAARISSPGLVRALGVGRVDPFFYLSSELVEGRTVSAILATCRAEGFPFAADHALMIASRAAVVLELLHARQDETGRGLFHGLVAPQHLAVAFDGDVKLKRLGLWPALRATGLLSPEQRAYLAPEQLTGLGEPRSDVYALGLVLLEALSGTAPDGSDPLGRLAAAHFTNAAGEKTPLPQPLAELLRRALGREPDERFQSVAEMRKAIDAVLFAGDFAPTTFDLAFFMHTLFREDVEREAQSLEEARSADYREFLTPEAPAAAPAAGPPLVHTEPFVQSAPVPTEVPAPTLAEAPRPTEEPLPPGPRSVAADVAAPRQVSRASREAGAREAASRLALGSATPGPGVRRSLWLVLALVGAVVVGGGAGWVYFVALRRPASRAASDPQAVADAHVRELEARIAQLEREKADAEAHAAEEAGRKVEQQAAAGGQAADPAAVARAQEEARQRARAEQERKQQEELTRLAEQKRAEQQRLAAEAAAKPAPTPTRPPAPTPPPELHATPAPLPPASDGATAVAVPAGTMAPGPAGEVTAIGVPPSPQAQLPSPTPAAEVGSLATPPPNRPAAVDPSDPAVKPPVLASEDQVPYPAKALSRRIAATVLVRALVDESGRVVEAAIVQSSNQRTEYGFDEAALKRVLGRHYRPARRNDVAVPIWVVVRVEFRPPR
jgi:TonB family protein